MNKKMESCKAARESYCTLWPHPQFSLIFPVQTPPAVAYLVPVLMRADTSVTLVNWASLLIALSLLLQTKAFPGTQISLNGSSPEGAKQNQFTATKEKKGVLGLTASEWSLIGNEKP